MAQRLVIYVSFEDDSDFDYFRTRFVAASEELADGLTNVEDNDYPNADGGIVVEWDVEDV